MRSEAPSSAGAEDGRSGPALRSRTPCPRSREGDAARPPGFAGRPPVFAARPPGFPRAGAAVRSRALPGGGGFPVAGPDPERSDSARRHPVRAVPSTESGGGRRPARSVFARARFGSSRFGPSALRVVAFRATVPRAVAFRAAVLAAARIRAASPVPRPILRPSRLLLPRGTRRPGRTPSGRRGRFAGSGRPPARRPRRGIGPAIPGPARRPPARTRLRTRPTAPPGPAPLILRRHRFRLPGYRPGRRARAPAHPTRFPLPRGRPGRDRPAARRGSGPGPADPRRS